MGGGGSKPKLRKIKLIKSNTNKIDQGAKDGTNYYTFAAGWYKGHDIEHKTSGCNPDESQNCGYQVEVSRWKKCRGCRTRIYCANACGDKLHYTPSNRGNPCGSRSSKNYRGQIHAKAGGDAGFVCVYDKRAYLKDDVLRSLSKNGTWTTAGVSGQSMYDQLLVGTQKPNKRNFSAVGKGYCEQVGNLDKVIHHNGETCYRYLSRKVSAVAAKQKAADFCKSKLTAIKSELCTRENIGKNKYDELAGKYCDTDDGKKDEWCACYNAFSGKCSGPDALDYAGCEGVKIEHKRLIDDIPPDQLSGSVKQQLTERMHCRNNVCKITKGFKPDGADKCDLNLNLCIQDVNVAGHLVDSGVQLTCNNTMNVGSGEKGSEKQEGEGATSDGGAADRKKKTLIFGATTVTSSSISCCCLILIIVIILMMSGGNKKRTPVPPSMNLRATIPA